MALGKPLDLTNDFNTVYNITQDMSGWDKTDVQVVAPMSGVIYVYASNDGNALQGVRDGQPQFATNFMPTQAVNIATGTATNSISAAGNYRVTVDAQYLRLQGNPAATPTNVYRLLLFNSKIS